MSDRITSSLEDRRLAVGWDKRNEAAAAAGLKPGELWSLEHGKSTKDKTAESRYERWLETQEARKEAGYIINAYPAPPGGKVEAEWHGLKLGARFGLKHEPGIFTFQGLVTERGGTQYVACYGGSPGYGMLRAIRMYEVDLPLDPFATDTEDIADVKDVKEISDGSSDSSHAVTTIIEVADVNTSSRL